MQDCDFKPNASGQLECPDCHWVYKQFGPRKPPRRNCPKSPDINTPEHRERIKQKMLGELPDHTTAILAQLDQCLTPCKEFNGRTCTHRGSACKKWQRWFEFLACSVAPCRYFEPTAG